MRVALIRLGRPGSLGWPTFLVLLVVQFAGSIISSRVNLDGRIIEFVAVRLLTILIGALALWLGELLRRRLGAVQAAVITISALAITVVIETTTFDWALQLAGFADESRLMNRLAMAFVGVFPALVITALVVTSLREHAARNAELHGVAERLDSTRSAVTARLEAHHLALQQRIDQLVRTEFDAALGADELHAADRMKRLLDDVVRPLSHQIEHEFTQLEPGEVPIPQGSIAWASVVRTALANGPMHTQAFTPWLSLMMASFLIPTFGAPGALASLLSAVFTAAMSTVVNFSWRRLPGGANSVVRAGFGVSVIALVSFGLAFIVRQTVGFSLLSIERMVAWVVLCEVLAWTIALLSTVFVLLNDTNRSLTVAVDELQREVAGLSGALRQQQRSVSRALHGPVQRAVAASIRQLQLDHAMATDPLAITDIRHRIGDALDAVRRASSNQLDLRHALDELCELWQGVTPIEVSVTEADLSTLRASPGASFATHELVSEAVTNAMKHGDPTRVSVQIAVAEDERTVRVTVDNDGEPLSPAPPSGLGATLLTELSLRWHLEQVGDVVRLEADIPLG